MKDRNHMTYSLGIKTQFFLNNVIMNICYKLSSLIFDGLVQKLKQSFHASGIEGEKKQIVSQSPNICDKLS